MSKILLIALAILLLVSTILFAQDTDEKINIVSINDIKKMMAEKFALIEDYSADFEWVNGNVNYYGRIQYKKPGKILLNFEEPEEQVIVSNESTLYIYLPKLKIVAQQALNEDAESTILAAASESGLAKLIDEYSFSFYDTSSLQYFKKTMAYHLTLNQKKAKVGFKKMDIWVSDTGLILQSNGSSQSGINVSLTFLNIKLNTELPDYIFDFEIPTDAQIIRNIIIPFSDKY
ncbi:MAG TPA: outer membrane lipoprotein carrier protein LolA [Spirochaetes bacterium]|nr:outer membrane lipoprotein carrier protein LolA [Spirochaetota bacterium]